MSPRMRPVLESRMDDRADQVPRAPLVRTGAVGGMIEEDRFAVVERHGRCEGRLGIAVTVLRVSAGQGNVADDPLVAVDAELPVPVGKLFGQGGELHDVVMRKSEGRERR